MRPTKKVVIIGGGISGLCTAYYLEKAFQQTNERMKITVVESSNQVGGNLRTTHEFGSVIEHGPDSFLVHSHMSELIAQLNLEEELLFERKYQRHILHQNKLHPVPDSVVYGIPTSLKEILRSTLLSPKGKFRAFFELVQPAGNFSSEDSVGSFLRRRLGDEITERITTPLLMNSYLHHVDNVSIHALFPTFRRVEEQHNSLIRGMKKIDIQNKQAVNFMSLKSGMQKLVDTLKSELLHTDFILERPVLAVEKERDSYRLQLQGGQSVLSDYVVFTGNPSAFARLIPSESVEKLSVMAKGVPVAVLVFSFYQKDVLHLPQSVGFVVSEYEKYNIRSCTFMHQKWPEKVNRTRVMLRCNVVLTDESLTNEQLIRRAYVDLQRILNIQAEPESVHVFRYHEALPMFSVEYVRKVDEVKRFLKEDFPGVFVIGSGFSGMGLDRCVQNAKIVVERILRNNI
ncbi:MAG: protoporphyrinogen oxidase [Bacilli bacterium]